MTGGWYTEWRGEYKKSDPYEATPGTPFLVKGICFVPIVSGPRAGLIIAVTLGEQLRLRSSHCQRIEA
jgi:hypothetical protein